jgi:hypothetical protein
LKMAILADHPQATINSSFISSKEDVCGFYIVKILSQSQLIIIRILALLPTYRSYQILSYETAQNSILSLCVLISRCIFSGFPRTSNLLFGLAIKFEDCLSFFLTTVSRQATFQLSLHKRSSLRLL